MNKENIIKEFDKHFTRDDGLIDKYSWYGVDGEPHPQPTPDAIKMFILKVLSSQRQEIISDIDNLECFQPLTKEESKNRNLLLEQGRLQGFSEAKKQIKKIIEENE